MGMPVNSQRKWNPPGPQTGSARKTAICAMILIAPTFASHGDSFGSRLWSKILTIAGVKLEHQWKADEYKAFLEQNGWRVVNAKLMEARITMLYTECVRNNRSMEKSDAAE